MATHYDDNIPRNWDVFCMNIDNRLIHRVININSLCDGKSGPDVICVIPDKKAYYVDNIFKCSRIRFTNTGFDSSGQCFFVLSGIEIFGAISSIFYHECNEAIIIHNRFCIFQI